MMQSFETFDDQDEAQYDDSFKELESFAVLKNCIHDLPENFKGLRWESSKTKGF
ncbi:hypothetical protein C1H46_009865 [Malus baccata]|uniref:Uncharacterized protein n=1 Tax=Malus baccata TaxID=106549 RepID=A0A540N0H3_MALBA|nr:hypothetical protein C1H46_009865 [Malus baccata]